MTTDYRFVADMINDVEEFKKMTEAEIAHYEKATVCKEIVIL